MKRLFGISLAGLALTTACSSSSSGSPPGSPPLSSAKLLPFTVTGSVQLGPHLATRETNRSGSSCFTTGNEPDQFATPSKWDDVRKGAQVVIANQAGRTVAVTTLGGGRTTESVIGGRGFPPCSFPFTAKDVPPSKFYKVTVGKRSGQFSFEQMQGAPVIMVTR